MRLSTSDAMLSGALVAWIAVFGTGITSIPHLGDFGTWFKAALTGTLSIILMFVALYLTWFLVLRRIKQSKWRVAATLLAYLCVSALRGLILSWLLIALTGERIPTDATLYRVSANTTWMFMFLVLGVYVVAITRQQRAKLAEAIAKRSQVEAVLDSMRISNLDFQLKTLEQVHDKINQEIVNRQAGPQLSSRTLEALASEVISPVSHELARRTSHYDIPQISSDDYVVPLRRFLLQINLPRFIQPSFSVVILIISWAGTGLSVFGFPDFLQMYLVFMPILFALLLGMKAFFNRFLSLPNLLALFLALLFTIVSTLCALSITAKVFPQLGSRLDVQVAIVIQATEFILFVATAFAVRRQGDISDRNFRTYSRKLDWLEARARLESWSLDNRLAQVLHGPAQAELYATGETWKDLPESEVDVDEYLDNYSDSFRQQLLSVLGPNSNNNLEGVVRSTINFWSHTCAITFDQDTAAANLLKHDAAASDVLEGIIQETVSNTVVHGRANDIHIRLTSPQDDLVALTVSDNGQTDLRAEPQDSQGAAQLQACTLDWKHTCSHGQNTLTASIPIELTNPHFE